MYFVYSSIEREVKFIFAPASALLEQETEARETESLRNIYIHAFLLVFRPSRAVAGSKFPDQGLNPGPRTVEVHSPNHWTIRAVQEIYLEEKL